MEKPLYLQEIQRFFVGGNGDTGFLGKASVFNGFCAANRFHCHYDITKARFSKGICAMI